MAPTRRLQMFWMPRACPVEFHVRWLKERRFNLLDATGQARGIFKFRRIR
jgi:hypothetical protein